MIVSSAIGLMILLVLSDIITLKTRANIKRLYNALLICLLLLVSALAIKLIAENNKIELQPSKNSDFCDKDNAPFWCHNKSMRINSWINLSQLP